MKRIDLNALASLLKSILDHYLEMDKIDLMIDYFTKERNRKEIRSLLKNPRYSNLLHSLLLEITHRASNKFFESGLSSKFITKPYCKPKHNLREQLKHRFIENIRRDFAYFQSSSLFLSCIISSLFTIESFGDKSLNVITSVFKVVLMYYLVLPLLFKVADSIINDYIKQKIHSIDNTLQSINALELPLRFSKLFRDDYQFLFKRINEIKCKNAFLFSFEPDVYNASIPVPSLKFLTSFYIKNATDIDVKTAPVPIEVKEYINNIREIEEWEKLNDENWPSFYQTPGI